MFLYFRNIVLQILKYFCFSAILNTEPLIATQYFFISFNDFMTADLSSRFKKNSMR